MWKQFVPVNTDISTILYALCGNPQWSIPGPVLFNLCVVYMSYALSKFQCLQCADGTTIYTHWKIKNFKVIEQNLETELKNFFDLVE